MSSSGHREKSPTLVARGRRSGTTTDRPVTSRTVSSVTSTSRRPRLAPETGRRRLSWCHDVRCAWGRGGGVPVAETPGSRGLYGFGARVAHPARVYDYWLGGKDNFEGGRVPRGEDIRPPPPPPAFAPG